MGSSDLTQAGFDSSSSGGFSLGFGLKMIDLEVGYLALVRFDSEKTADSDIEVDGFTLSIAKGLHLFDTLYLDLKGGLFRWRADAMALAAIITCEDGGSDTWSESLSGDTGTFTITANTFSGLTSDCTVSLNLQRCRSGLLDPNYGMGGIISGRQSRTVNFNTVE